MNIMILVSTYRKNVIKNYLGCNLLYIEDQWKSSIGGDEKAICRCSEKVCN